MWKNEAGFTLLELLIVLVIVSIVSLFVLPSMFKTVKSVKTQHYFEHLQSNVFMIQNSVLNREIRAYIDVVNDKYYIYKPKSVTMYRNPEGLINEFRTTNILFSPKGIINNPSSFLFRDETVRYQLIFPFGAGRGYINEF